MVGSSSFLMLGSPLEAMVGKPKLIWGCKVGSEVGWAIGGFEAPAPPTMFEMIYPFTPWL
jgi:hypothetical protein